MKFNLPRHILTEEMDKIISREIRRQKVYVTRPDKIKLNQLAKVVQAIEKHGLPKNLVCKKLPHNLGHGIFLHPKAKPILKGKIIAPYAGEIFFVPQNLPDDALYAFEPISHILLSKEEQAHFDKGHRYHPRRLYSMHVDALKKGNFTRFINHSEKPNVVAEFLSVPPNNFGLALSPIDVMYVAQKKIHPGEQLLVSYEGDDNSYWSALEMQPLPILPKTFQLDSSLQIIGSVNLQS